MGRSEEGAEHTKERNGDFAFVFMIPQSISFEQRSVFSLAELHMLALGD